MAAPMSPVVAAGRITEMPRRAARLIEVTYEAMMRCISVIRPGATTGVHPAGVAVPAVEDEGDVDVDDVALLERLLARNAVADHVIDRGAGRLAVAAIHQRR